MRLDGDGEHAVGDVGLGNALPVLVRRYPEVGCPHLYAELARQEDGRDRGAAPEVEHAHPGLELEHLRQPLGEPKTFGPMWLRNTHVGS